MRDLLANIGVFAICITSTIPKNERPLCEYWCFWCLHHHRPPGCDSGFEPLVSRQQNYKMKMLHRGYEEGYEDGYEDMVSGQEAVDGALGKEKYHVKHTKK